MSLNDMTLTKVTYGKYAPRVPDEVAYGIYEWFSSQKKHSPPYDKTKYCTFRYTFRLFKFPIKLLSAEF